MAFMTKFELLTAYAYIWIVTEKHHVAPHEAEALKVEQGDINELKLKIRFGKQQIEIARQQQVEWSNKVAELEKQLDKLQPGRTISMRTYDSLGTEPPRHLETTPWFCDGCGARLPLGGTGWTTARDGDGEGGIDRPNAKDFCYTCVDNPKVETPPPQSLSEVTYGIKYSRAG